MLKPLSVQLYSLRDAAAKDFVKVLEWVAQVGFAGVEPAGFWNLRPTEFKKIVEDLGMKIYSAHSPWARPGNLGECMEIADILGLKQIVCGYGSNEFKDLDSIKATAEMTCQMQEILERNGFQLFQHNHDFEFERIDGKLKYEIYRELCPKVKYQIDCFWSTSLGRENPVEMLKLFSKDVVSIHMKDGVVKQNVGGNDMVNGILDRHVDLLPLGTGELPIPELIANVPDQVSSVVVELDYCQIDMFEAIEKSYKYMTSNKLAIGNK